MGISYSPVSCTCHGLISSAPCCDLLYLGLHDLHHRFQFWSKAGWTKHVWCRNEKNYIAWKRNLRAPKGGEHKFRARETNWHVKQVCAHGIPCLCHHRAGPCVMLTTGYKSLTSARICLVHINIYNTRSGKILMLYLFQYLIFW